MNSGTGDAPTLLIGGYDGKQLRALARMTNRHGLIAGATGTGKTVTLQVLAEGFSRLGVPVFMADIKGDLSGIAKPGTASSKIADRVKTLAINDYQARGNPVVFWDLFGELGHPIRTTVSEMGPLLFSNLLELNEIQTGVLYTAFKVADEQGLLLLDLKDLRALLAWMADNADALQKQYGNVSGASVGAIQRSLLVLDQQGAEHFFGEPAVKVEDLIQADFSGNGVIHIMDVTKLVQNSPRLYATFLLWLLAELFENLPEVGDADRPKFVMFFDEAHLLFNQAPKALLEKVEQVVRLIRSKGVGVYFISQSPLDVPESVLGQLGLRVQHALRAFTPKDKKAVKTAAETFRPNPKLKTDEVITELGIGEALVSVLDEKGSPTPVERVMIRPPESRIGPLTAEERKEQLSRSPFKGKYDKEEDRESAYELLKKRAEQQAATEAQAAREKDDEKRGRAEARSTGRTSNRQTVTEAFVKSMARTIGSKAGQQLVRGILGSLLGGKR